jgi:hypothetical protein
MNNYTVLKWGKLLLWLIPPILRKKTHFDWLEAVLIPLRNIYEETLYKMQHTGQVIYLEKVLNDAFNQDVKYNPNLSIEEKREKGLIYIDESVKPTLQYLYLHKEYYEPDGTLIIPQLKVFKHDEYNNRDNQPIYLAHRKDYTSVAYANFRVYIPETLIGKKDGIVVQSQNDGSILSEAINVATIKYHSLLNFYKLAGKSYESYSY